MIRLLTALAKATKGKPAPSWVSVDSLGLVQKHEYLEATIDRAVEAGWVSVGRRPAHSITITAEGLQQITV